MLHGVQKQLQLTVIVTWGCSTYYILFEKKYKQRVDNKIMHVSSIIDNVQIAGNHEYLILFSSFMPYGSYQTQKQSEIYHVHAMGIAGYEKVG